MSDNSLVSVIIPTYNRAHILKSAIESVLQQTYTNIQLLVIDDGSTDNTSELIKAYPQVEYIVKDHAGQASARNYGLKNSKGSIVASLDSDDVWSPDFLTQCVSKLEADKLDFVFANWLQYTEQGEAWNFLINDPFLNPYLKKTPDDWITLTYPEVRNLYLLSCPSPSSSVVIRKSSIGNGWNEKMIIGDDWCMYLDVILNRECKVAFTLNQLWKKRVDSLNIYDGRKRSEILKYLLIADVKTMMEKFRQLLLPEEMEILEQRYIASLVELAKHETLRELNVFESIRLIKTALAVDRTFTFRMIPYILKTGLKRKINPLKSKSVNKL